MEKKIDSIEDDHNIMHKDWDRKRKKKRANKNKNVTQRK